MSDNAIGKPKPTYKTCAASVEGPKYGRRVVAWRRLCRNRPRKNKHYCAVHKYLERD